MNLDFQGDGKKFYNNSVSDLFHHMDVMEHGGELEVTDHGGTDSKKFLAGNRGEQLAGQGLTGIPILRARCRMHGHLTHTPPFFFLSHACSPLLPMRKVGYE